MILQQELNPKFDGWAHRLFAFVTLHRVAGHRLNSHGARLWKDVGVDVHHEVSSGGVLHDKTHVFRRLETRKQVDQERMAGAVDRFKDALLAHQAESETSRGDGQKGHEGESQGGTEMRRRRRRRAWSLPFHFVPRDDVAFLQGFDGVQVACPLVFRQQHLESPRKKQKKKDI